MAELFWLSEAGEREAITPGELAGRLASAGGYLAELRADTVAHGEGPDVDAAVLRRGVGEMLGRPDVLEVEAYSLADRCGYRATAAYGPPVSFQMVRELEPPPPGSTVWPARFTGLPPFVVEE